MKLRTRSGRLLSAIGLGAVLSAVTAYAAISQVCGAGHLARPELSVEQAPETVRALNAAPRKAWGRSPSGAPAEIAGDVVMEWNQQATTRTLSASPALAPVQQTRVMAIIQVAVHDAVNGITGQYATYLSPGDAPASASPEAAAIAAAHHALKNLPVNQSPSLDDAFAASLAAHGLSEFDPGVEYGRAAAATVLAARANDNSATAQFPYTAPGAGDPGVWVPISAAPNAQALLPGWGDVTPFVLRSGSQFRPDAPPALD